MLDEISRVYVLMGMVAMRSSRVCMVGDDKISGMLRLIVQRPCFNARTSGLFVEVRKDDDSSTSSSNYMLPNIDK